MHLNAQHSQMDSTTARRSQEHTDLLVEEFELGVLLDEYGLVGDVVVRLFIFASLPYVLPIASIAGTIGMSRLFQLADTCTLHSSAI
jgi:hypothetical protein